MKGSWLARDLTTDHSRALRQDLRQSFEMRALINTGLMHRQATGLGEHTDEDCCRTVFHSGAHF